MCMVRTTNTGKGKHGGVEKDPPCTVGRAGGFGCADWGVVGEGLCTGCKIIPLSFFNTKI